MGNRTKLLATVALPLASLIWQPANAAAIRPMQPAGTAQGVIQVQSDESGLSEEELRKLRRKQRQQQAEEQKGAAEEQQQSDKQKAREERRKKQQEQKAEEQNRAAEEQQQSDKQKAREERRKKQQEQQAEEQNRAAEEQQQSDKQKAREERRKKQQEQQAEEQNRAAEEQQQSDKQKAREERRKKQQEQQAEEQNRAAEEQPQSDKQKAREERRKKQQEQQAEEQNRAAEEQPQSDKQKAREERRKQQEQQAEEQNRAPEEQPQTDKQKAREERRKQQEQQAEEQNRAAEEQPQTDKQKAREERRKQLEAQREQDAAQENRQRPRRERDPERERVARDPSKTTETIDLPVVGGAAVLDSDKDADNRRDGSREERRKRRAEQRRAEERQNERQIVPTTDADAQVDRDGNRRRPVRYESIERERGERSNRRPGYRDPDNVRVDRRDRDRVIYNIDNRTIVRNYDGNRLSRRAQDTYYENLSGGRVRETIERPGGVRVVTIRDGYGDVVQRSRFVGDREYVLYYVPETDYYVEDRVPFRDPGLYLPPMRLTVPVEDYIIDTSSDYDRDYRAFLAAPPVEAVERVYTLDEVKYSARIRDKVRRIDLDTITFATGSAEISMEQASTLRQVADAINNLLDENPGETFLIEGHTDAVGSDESNLILSDERAESVADLLTDVYDIPPENLSTQGYGERYLKILTDGPEQLNRRVTIRRVTPLVKPVASAQ
ncbi:outer membrane protein OmpA-like peptidoglycan-associated protein [Mycoplana sp. BE70]|uniref:OmpA family protein n=1 Tax=Mycoplana sp. BE70 TaxID=2817775 RepID=UPI002859DF5F|nr:OmpA family protein [Mycoplana sp. BE70]MDR6758531.1 outer membrane protein OmpA-like peptidoglycan-associated protein [Mycoplana sp. BE70]